MVVQRKSLVDIAMSRIKEHIIKNGFAADDKYLSEKELTERLQVSRTVIREALITLQSIGLINIIPGDGVYIANPHADPIKAILKHYEINDKKLKELADIRKVIELGAIRLIVENNLTFDADKASELNERYLQAIQANEDTRALDQQFHQFLMQSTQNETFYHFNEIINEYFSITKLNIVQTAHTLQQSYEEHKQLIEAISEKQMSHAQQLMIAHLQPIFTFVKQLEDVT